MATSFKRCNDGDCFRPARWIRCPSCETALPELLCAHHWSLLKSDFPLFAIEYNPIALMPGEILSDEVVKHVETPQQPTAE